MRDCSDSKHPPHTAMTDRDVNALVKSLKDLSFKGEECTRTLQLCHATFGELKQDSYGMIEDTEFLIPVKPTHNRVDRLRLARWNSVKAVEKKLQLIRKELVGLNRLVIFSQQAAYRHAVTEQRFLGQKAEEKAMKRGRIEQAEEARAKKAKLYQPDKPVFNLLTESSLDQNPFLL